MTPDTMCTLSFTTRRFLALSTLLCLPTLLAAASARQPNVVLILTDDQGYGDLACHGNPILKTPHLDALHAAAVRFTDFHAMPFCTPSRAALMTGHQAAHTGAYRTSSGRTMMHPDEVTMAQVFRDNGYATGIFGKWHLGDNYPHRPQDRGFQETLWHRCGGVGQASDYWGNDYFDDTYEHNGVFEQFMGYCTDVWFEGALDFIETNKDRPFFCYIPTNAPHGPYNVAAQYSDPYKDTATWPNGAAFYGMIANIDENVGRLREKLREWGLEENTILLFMTDNGTAGGNAMGIDDIPQPGNGFNAGMRGRKASIYDGGHRVPCFVHWPAGGIVGGRDVDRVAALYDVLPTLIDLCGLVPPPGVTFDGQSLRPLLEGNEAAWPDRTLILQYLGGAGFLTPPAKWEFVACMTDRWRLLDGTRLYDIDADPTQDHDVAAQHPEVVSALREAYETWWEAVSPRIAPVYIHVGNDAENPVRLCSQDWYLQSGNPPWNFNSIQRLPKVTGPWMINVERPGTYEITLRQWPREAHRPLVARSARIRIAGIEQVHPVEAGQTGTTFTLDLPAGKTTLDTFLTDEAGAVGGAYFADVTYRRSTGKGVSDTPGMVYDNDRRPD